MLRSQLELLVARGILQPVPDCDGYVLTPKGASLVLSVAEDGDQKPEVK